MWYRNTPKIVLSTLIALGTLATPMLAAAQPAPDLRSVPEIKRYLSSTTSGTAIKACKTYQEAIISAVRTTALAASSDSLKKQNLPPLSNQELRDLVQDTAQGMADSESDPAIRQAITAGIQRFMSTGRIGDMERGMAGFQEACIKKMASQNTQVAQNGNLDMPDYQGASPSEPRALPDYLQHNDNLSPTESSRQPTQRPTSTGLQLPKQSPSTLRR